MLPVVGEDDGSEDEGPDEIPIEGIEGTHSVSPSAGEQSKSLGVKVRSRNVQSSCLYTEAADQRVRVPGISSNVRATGRSRRREDVELEELEERVGGDMSLLLDDVAGEMSIDAESEAEVGPSRVMVPLM